MHRKIAATRYTILVVPHADGRTGRMTVAAKRVGVDRRLDAFFFCLRQGAGKDLVAAATHGELAGQDILQTIGVEHGFGDSSRHVGFTGAQDISVLLHIGIQAQIGDAEIDMQQITFAGDLSGRMIDETLQMIEALAIIALDRHGRMEPGIEAKIVDPLTQPPDHIVAGRDAGRDDRFGECFGDY